MNPLASLPATLLWDVAVTTLLVTLTGIPLAISTWAFLDVARRPAWVWALAGGRRLLWMGLIAFGVLTVIGGLAISGWYLLRVRPALAAIENGDLGAVRPSGPG